MRRWLLPEYIDDILPGRRSASSACGARRSTCSTVTATSW